jgi:hypothetical protein
MLPICRLHQKQTKNPVMGFEPRNISTSYKLFLITVTPGLVSAVFILHFETVTAVMTQLPLILFPLTLINCMNTA